MGIEVIIYLAVNKKNHKPYVGLSRRSPEEFWKRLNEHRGQPRMPFSRALRKYGADGFEYAVLQQTDNRAELARLEKHWIEAIGARHPVGYNLTDGGDGASGYRPTKADRRKLRPYWDRIKTERLGAGNPNYGNHSPWSDKRRAASPAEHHSKRPEVKEAMSKGRAKAWETQASADAIRDNLRKIGKAIFDDPVIRERHREAVRAYHARQKAAGIPGHNAGKKFSKETRRFE